MQNITYSYGHPVDFSFNYAVFGAASLTLDTRLTSYIGYETAAAAAPAELCCGATPITINLQGSF